MKDAWIWEKGGCVDCIGSTCFGDMIVFDYLFLVHTLHM